MMRDLVVLALCATVMGCGPSIVGRSCDTSDPCPANFVCASTTGTSTEGRCLRACDMSTETVCEDGTACLPLDPDGHGACYLGGSVPIGGECMYQTDCTRTGVCLTQAVGSKCFVGCNLNGTHPCSDGFACLQDAAGVAGFCASGM